MAATILVIMAWLSHDLAAPTSMGNQT